MTYGDQTHAINRYPMSTTTNPNQPAGASDSLLLSPPAHIMSPRTDAAPTESPHSGPDMAMTLTGAAGERLEERLQPTLKEAKLALDGAESVAEITALWTIGAMYVLIFFNMLASAFSLGMIVTRSPSSPPSAGVLIATSIVGVLSTFISVSLSVLVCGPDLMLLSPHVHNLKMLICELEAFMVGNRRRHYVVVDLEIEEKVAGYPRRFMEIMGQPEGQGRVEGGEQMGRMKTTVAVEKRKTEKSVV